MNYQTKNQNVSDKYVLFNRNVWVFLIEMSGFFLQSLIEMSG
jgi:hypothetical protein